MQKNKTGLLLSQKACTCVTRPCACLVFEVWNVVVCVLQGKLWGRTSRLQWPSPVSLRLHLLTTMCSTNFVQTTAADRWAAGSVSSVADLPFRYFSSWNATIELQILVTTVTDSSSCALVKCSGSVDQELKNFQRMSAHFYIRKNYLFTSTKGEKCKKLFGVSYRTNCYFKHEKSVNQPRISQWEYNSLIQGRRTQQQDTEPYF